MLNRGFWTNFWISGLLCSESTGSPSNARANTRPSKQSERRKFPSRESRQFFSGNLPTKFVNWLHVTTSTSAWWCQIAIFFAFCAKRRDESSKTNPIDSGKAWRDSPWETQNFTMGCFSHIYDPVFYLDFYITITYTKIVLKVEKIQFNSVTVNILAIEKLFTISRFLVSS